MATSDNVLTKLHDLLLYIIPQLAKFPRDQKFILGDRIPSPDVTRSRSTRGTFNRSVYLFTG